MSNGKRKVKVIVDALSAREGGGQTYLRNLLAHDPGVLLDIVVLAPPSLSLPRLSPQVSRVDAPDAVARPLLRMAWGRYSLPSILHRLRPDVYFSPGGTLPDRLPPGCRTVTMSRNMLPFDARQRQRYPLGYPRTKARMLQRVLLRSMMRADLVIFVSEHGERIVQGRAGGRLHRTVVIPHGVSKDFRAQSNIARPSWLTSDDYVLYVSNFEPYKSHLDVIRAFAILKKRRPGSERLVLVGRASIRPYAKAIHREISRLGIGGAVVVAGPRPHAELPAIYHHARAGVFASECENCPNILLEGMAAGLSMTISNVAPMPEFASDATSYFHPRRPHEIADRLEALLADKELAKALSERALARASLYDWSRTAQRTWASIAGLLEEPPTIRSKRDRRVSSEVRAKEDVDE